MRASNTYVQPRRCVAIVLSVVVLCSVIWLGSGASPTTPATAGATVTTSNSPVIRIGVVPERDIFAQRKRYLALSGYLTKRLGRPVEIVTGAAYQNILEDFATNHVDAAFLGSFSTVLAFERQHARIIARPVLNGEISSYHGVIVVRADSPVQTLDDLRGRSIALVRMTMAAHLFPFAELQKRGLLAPEAKVRRVWVGTHDEVILDLADGRVDAGAVKDLRLDEYERVHGQGQFRRLATSPAAPENSLVARQGFDESIIARLSDALLAMKDDPDGKTALNDFGALRFEPCEIKDYQAVYDLIAELGPAWPSLGISGEPIATKVPTTASSP